MGGYDFGVLWKAGQAVLLGQDPYGVNGFFYPLPVAVFFAPFALLPRQVAFWVWVGLNLVVLGLMLRRRAVAWVLYFPVVHLLSSGQVDLMLWALDYRFRSGWKSALAAAVITLKPQVAFNLLPWTLGWWSRKGRRLLVTWVCLVIVLWASLLPFDPTWPLRWRAAVSPLDATSRGNAPGLRNLERLFPERGWVLLILAIVVFVWGLFQKRSVCRAAAALANPSGLFYTLLVLMETAPPWLMVPVSWVAVGLTLWQRVFAPWMLIPLAVILYHQFRRPSKVKRYKA
ncbi:MAG: DUF2029 domain-containing protein [Anaerolineae bacterium]|nr:DUF2029 domain-containing protein [Anaerolineae bacterium]